MNDFIYQINKNECGFSCIKMLLASLYKDSRYLYLPHKKDINEQYSLLELKDIAKEYGLILSGYLVKDYSSLISSNRPFILVKKLSNGDKHCVLVKKIIFKKFAYVYDPAVGKKIVRVSKLFELENEGVEVLKFEGLNKMDFKYQIDPLVSKKNRVTLLLIEVLLILSFFLSAYFVNEKSHFLYPIILIVVGCIFSILYKSQTYIILKKFDDDYIRCTYDENKKVKRDNYNLMHLTKSGLFTSTNNIILTLSSALAVNTILILQNYYSIFVLLTSLVVIVIDYLFITPRIKNRATELEFMESNLLDKDNMSSDEYFEAYSQVKEKTYKIAGLIDMKRLISIFILLIVVFLMTAMGEKADISYVLFYFAMSLFTYTSFDNVILMIEKNKENIINQTKFYELIIKNKENNQE